MLKLFRRNPRKPTIEALYGAIVAQARLPIFYTDYGVPDTVNGRLDLIMLHLALLFERLSQGGKDDAELGQEVFDRFCRDVDDHLREEGISDLKVPKQMHRMAAAFFGRHGAYLSAIKSDDEAALAQALLRNVYLCAEGEVPDPALAVQAARLATYVRRASKGLAEQPVSDVAAGKLSWIVPALG